MRILIFLFLASIVTSHAQSHKMGIAFNSNLIIYKSKIAPNPEHFNSTASTLGIGFYYEYKVKKWMFGAEEHFINKKYTTSSNSTALDLVFHGNYFLSFSVFVGYFLHPKLSFTIAPELTFPLLNITINPAEQELSASGGIIGINFHPYKSFDFALRYRQGLSRYTINKITNSYLQFGVKINLLNTVE